MAQHRKSSPEKVTQGGRHRASHQLGAHALGADRNGGRHVATDDGVEEASSFWQSVAHEVKISRERVAASKRMYERGLNKLVQAGVYDSRILRRMSYISAMTMVVEGQPDPRLEHAYAYADSHGRYIATKTLDDEMTMMHEFAHRSLRMGKPGWNVFREPLAERVARDIGQVEHIETDRPPAYRVHTRIMNKVLDASGMTFRDMTRIASGDDQEENYYIFREEVMARTGGLDLAGIAQNAYVYHSQVYIQAYPDGVGSEFYAAEMAEKELDNYLSAAGTTS